MHAYAFNNTVLYLERTFFALILELYIYYFTTVIDPVQYIQTKNV